METVMKSYSLAVLHENHHFDSIEYLNQEEYDDILLLLDDIGKLELVFDSTLNGT